MNDLAGGRAHKFLRHLRSRRVKTWQLIFILAITTTLSVYSLRQNNLEMLQLRNTVIQADEQGGDVAAAIKNLNHHVFHHMNTEIVRPLELVNTYNRSAEAIIEEASKSSSRNVYKEATRNCEQRGIPLTSIAQCASEYIMRNKPADLNKEIVLPDKNRFTYTFASPLWTPDLAGWSLAATGVITLWLVARATEYTMVRFIIWRRKEQRF